MTWKIVTDSGSTLRDIKDLSQTIDYEIVPLSIITDAEEILDTPDIDLDYFVEQVKQAQKTSSACPSPEMYRQAFGDQEQVICFTITGTLSGSFNSADVARQQILEENPDRQIHIFNTYSAGPEQDLLIKKAISLIEEGLAFDDVIEQLNAYHEKTDLLFLLESIQNLVKNGRVNKMIGSLVGLLNLRLVGERSRDGRIELANRARGTKKGLKILLEEMIDKGYQGGRVEIVHMNNASLAQTMADRIRERFADVVIDIRMGTALCYYYGEENGLMIGFEK